MNRKMNTHNNTAYSFLYSNQCYEQKGTYNNLKIPSKGCQLLRDKIINTYKSNFKSKLGPNDRMHVPPVKLTLDKSKGITPTNHVRPYDTPYHLRKPWEQELKDALEGEILVPNTSPSIWSSKAFPVQKSDPSKVRIVADFRAFKFRLV